MPFRVSNLSLLLSSAAAVASFATAHADEAADSSVKVTDEVVVTHAAAQPLTSVTGLSLSIRETPQAVTVIRGEEIRDFGLNGVNELLNQTPNINVDQFETDRTTYNARGFDITNFQFDGVGLPLISELQAGALDTATFDRVEVVRGANAIMTGVGNPSATINYIRKRPTSTFQGNVAAEAGSWNDRRLEADVSGPLNASGTVRARLVAAGEAGDSYLDHYRSNRNVVYGVAAWDVTPDLTLAAGYTRNESRDKGVLWGALPLDFSDGTTIDYPSSASTSADWTYWNILDQNTFLEATYALPKDWTLKATATYRQWDEHAKLLYAYGNPDPVTGLGVAGMSGVYPSQYRQYMLDAVASGPFELFGRTHQLAAGASASRSTGKEWENFSTDDIAYPSVFDWGQAQVPEPSYPGEVLQTETVDKLLRVYASARLTFTDRLKGVVGATAVNLKTTGYAYGVDQARSESKVSPYLGLTYDLTPQVSLYASYTDIFNPQSEAFADHTRLPAAHGRSYEAGIKSEVFDNRLYLTGAVYKAEQSDLADYAGTDDNGQAYYVGLDTKVKGIEFEAAGRITDRWTINGGFTALKMDGPTDDPIRTYIPRRTLKAATTYAFPELRNLKLGAAVRWQSHTSVEDVGVINQDAYAVFDLTASVDVTDKVRATLNLKNVGDKKHYTTLNQNQAFYAEPRSVYARLDYAF